MTPQFTTWSPDIDTHTQPFYVPFSGTTQLSWIQKKSSSGLYDTVQGKITEADTPTTRLGATPSGLISDPPSSSPHYMPNVLPATTLPLCPGLGQAPNMLACIPSGLVLDFVNTNVVIIRFNRLTAIGVWLCY